MAVNRLQTILLTITGLIALLIGSLIAIDPVEFYSSYGITLAGNTDMLSELRAPGTNLAVLGAVILIGAWIKSMRLVSLLIGLIVFELIDQISSGGKHPDNALIRKVRKS